MEKVRLLAKMSNIFMACFFTVVELGQVSTARSAFEQFSTQITSFKEILVLKIRDIIIKVVDTGS